MVKKDRSLKGERNPNQAASKSRPHGERHGMHKLQATQVVEIRAALSAGINKRELAKRYGVTRQLIRRIEVRLVWNHLP